MVTIQDTGHTATDSIICRPWGTLKKQLLSNETLTIINGKKRKNQTRQAVYDDMTVTLGRRCNNLNDFAKNGFKLGPKINVKKQSILLQKTMLGIFTRLLET